MSIGRVVRRALGPLERTTTNGYRRLFIDLDQLARRLGAIVAADRIVEVGCGEGMFTERLARHFPNAKIVGIDIDERVGRLFRGDRERVTFRVQTAAACAAAHPESFDLAVLCDVLHHVPCDERPALLAAIHDAMAPGGSLLLKEWERRRNAAYVVNYLSDRFVTGDRVHFGTAAQWRETALQVFGPGCITQEFRVAPWPNNFALLILRR